MASIAEQKASLKVYSHPVYFCDMIKGTSLVLKVICMVAFQRGCQNGASLRLVKVVSKKKHYVKSLNASPGSKLCYNMRTMFFPASVELVDCFVRTCYTH